MAEHLYIGRDNKCETVILPLPFTLELALHLEKLFECRRCGGCCQNITQIFITQQEIERIAEYDEDSVSNVINKLGWKDSHTTKLCPYYANHACQIHPARPMSCHLYPFSRAVMPFSKPRIRISFACKAVVPILNLLTFGVPKPEEIICLQSKE
jgi:Fe-S-cluster containining protein